MLTVIVSSDNTQLIPAANLALTRSANGAGVILDIKPASDESGLAQITVTVTDSGGKKASAVFNVSVDVEPAYYLVEIPPLSGKDQSFALDINDDNVVVGYSDSENSPKRAFRYQFSPGSVPLELPSGSYDGTAALAINKDGKVVGYAAPISTPVFWTTDSGPTVIPWPDHGEGNYTHWFLDVEPIFEGSEIIGELEVWNNFPAEGYFTDFEADRRAVASNDMGTMAMVGKADWEITYFGSFLQRADGTQIRLPYLADQLPFRWNRVHQINNSGVIVGDVKAADFFPPNDPPHLHTRAYYSKPDTQGTYGIPTLVNVGEGSTATVINNRNLVAGTVNGQPFVLDLEASAPTVQSLQGFLSGDSILSTPTDINDFGKIVGTTFDNAAGTADPFLYQYPGHQKYDLNQIVENHPGFALREARAINSKGYIVGWGIRHGKSIGFVAAPAGVVGNPIAPPAGAVARRRPEVAISDPPGGIFDNSFLWGRDQRLYPIRPLTATVRWYTNEVSSAQGGSDGTTNQSVTCVWPRNAQLHVSGAPVELEPTEASNFSFDFVKFHHSDVDSQNQPVAFVDKGDQNLQHYQRYGQWLYRLRILPRGARSDRQAPTLGRRSERSVERSGRFSKHHNEDLVGHWSTHSAAGWGQAW